jgi:hypothetical protein
MKFHACTKLAIRLLYTPLVAAVKMKSIWEYVKRNQISDASLRVSRYRHDVRQGTCTNDRLFDLASRLRRSLMPFGSMELGGNLCEPKIPKTPSVRKNVDFVVADLPYDMILHLKRRAQLANRVVDQLDFIGNSMLPLADGARSGTTPGATVFKQSFISLTSDLVERFKKKPSSASHRKAKLDYWMNEGLHLRINPMIAHVVQEIDGRGKGCFWCQNRVHHATICLFCGEEFCSKPCENAFHTNMFGFTNEPPSRETSQASSDSIDTLPGKRLKYVESPAPLLPQQRRSKKLSASHDDPENKD